MRLSDTIPACAYCGENDAFLYLVNAPEGKKDICPECYGPTWGNNILAQSKRAGYCCGRI